MEQILGGKGKTMAEQIRSFWSHLCGIFGAIFGMIAGGTLVTIEHAEAYTGSRTCGNTMSNYTRETLYNGAVVYTCYGGGWLCAKVDDKSQYGGCTSSNLDSNGSCYVMNVYDNYPRHYTYFMGCADGYYSTEGIGYTTAVSSTISSTAVVPGLSMITGLGATSSIGVRKGYNPYTRGTENCYVSDSITFNTSTYEARGESMAFSGAPDGQAYEQDPTLLTNGKCAKCPTYGEYLARSEGGTYAKNVSSCFMTSYVPRYDSADQPDGNATGQFVWTNICNHDGDTTEYLATACWNKRAGGTCDVSLSGFSDEATAIKWVTEICGNTAYCGSMASGSINSRPLPYVIMSGLSCEAAKCYQTAAAADGVQITYTDTM